ncbi:MAG: phosphodiesterase [Clostridia bacterium]|nr:phosphodiesterase [Clostridia bacterium]
MKWLIASDLHGSARYTRELLAAFELEKADRLLLLGDILYHGPRNDLPEEYAPKQVIALLSGYKDRILCVRGNCDTEVDQMVLPFPILADYAILPVNDRLMYCTHGHVYNGANLPPLQKGDVLLHGHTHVPLCDVREDVTILNPGSTSIPKENSWHGYMTLEDGLLRWMDFSRACHREYQL